MHITASLLRMLVPIGRCAVAAEGMGTVAPAEAFFLLP